MHLLKLKPEMINISSKDRLYNLDIPLIGLTGGISTGKSTVSKLMREDNICVIDADVLVKSIYKLTETLDFIKDLDPRFIEDQNINFKKLRAAFFNDLKLKKTIEDYIYKHLPNEFQRNVQHNANFIVYDVPLLFEKKLDPFFDIIITVYTPRSIQIERLIKRDHCSQELAESILNQQLDIELKKDNADFVIDNSKDLTFLMKQYRLLKDKIFK